MTFLLFFIYLAGFCLLLIRLSFFNKSGLQPRLLVALFLIKVAASVVVSYVYLHYYKGSDVAFYHKYGLLEHQLLLSNPREWVRNLFYAGYETGYAGFFATRHSYWNNLSPNVIIKMLSIFNFISAKNVYINSLFFNFLVFFAPVALFRVFAHAFAPWRPALIAALFLLPSALVFTSMVHKEGLIFLGLSLIIYHIYFWNRKKNWEKSGLIFFFTLLIFALRNYVFIALVPAVFCWLITVRMPQRSFLIFSGIYMLMIILFFTSPYLFPVNLMEFLTTRREAFEAISPLAATGLESKELQPNFISFIKNFPSAVINGVFKPQPLENQKAFYWLFKLEVIALEILIILFLIFYKGNRSRLPLTLFMLFFSVTVLMIIGYTIPILGAIVRYRSVYFVVLSALLISHINWKKIGILLH